MNIRRATVIGELSRVTGYGIHTLQVIKWLMADGIHVAVRATKVASNPKLTVSSDILSRIVHSPQPEPFEIVVAPSSFSPTPGKKTIWWTMFEATLIPTENVEKLNRAEVIVVPNEWNKGVFIKSGVNKPIRVVPLGIDPDIFKPTPMHMFGPCTFGAAGRMTNGRVRKGIDEVIDCFKRGFPRTLDVKLNIKVSPDFHEIKESDPRIFVLRQDWEETEVSRFLSGNTCFVSAARGEGWGLWQRQSLQVGRPVIASLYAGLSEIDAACCYPVPFNESPADQWTGGGNWCVPDYDRMIEAMRRVYIDRAEARFKGQIASGNQSSWQQSVKEFSEVLREFGAI